jgi:membrane-associated phospholipid phosphatase
MLLWLISIVVAGAIMSARLYLGAHTLREVYAGAAAGIATASVSMLILF